MLTNRGSSSESWVEMIDNDNILKSQYDVVAGHWPKKYNEVILVVNDKNEITDITLYALGIKNTREFMKEMSKAMKGEKITHSSDNETYKYKEILDLKYKLVLPFEQYKYNKDTKLWEDKSKDKKYMIDLIEKSIDLNIVGIVRPKADSVSTVMQAGSIGYTSDLSKYIIEKSNESKIVKEQKSKKDIDIFTGIKFDFDAKNAEITAKDVKKYIAELPKDERAKIEPYITQMNDKQLVEQFSKYVTLEDTDATYEGNLAILCAANFDKPKEINIYAKDFKSKEKIEEIMDDYNNDMKEKGKEENVITDIDMVGIMMDSVSNIIDIVSYVLIAFVSISLVVSSIMIGIITYISVLERTKEIGILRSIGASKKDVSRVFNAETIIIGFVAGAIGIGVTLLINIPANIIIKNLTDIDNIAKLPPMGGVILVIISMVLTFIAGLIPSSYAAKKDPVIALRSE